MIKRFLHDTSAVALIEFVFVLPLLMILFYGGYEVNRYINVIQKVENSAYTLGNIITQYDPPTAAGLNGELKRQEITSVGWRAFRISMRPYGQMNRRAAIITSVRRDTVGTDHPVRVKWQIGMAGYVDGATTSYVNGVLPGSPASHNSAISPTPEAAALNAIANDENIIVVETFYRYEPLVAEVLNGLGGEAFVVPPVTLHRAVFLHPRKGDLVCLPPPYDAVECTP